MIKILILILAIINYSYNQTIVEEQEDYLKGEDSYKILKTDMNKFVQQELITKDQGIIIWEQLHKNNSEQNNYFKDILDEKQDSWSLNVLSIFLLFGMGLYCMVLIWGLQVIKEYKLVSIFVLVLSNYFLTILTDSIQNQLNLQIIASLLYMIIAYKWSIIFFIFLKFIQLIDQEQISVFDYIFDFQNRSEFYIIINIGIGYCLAFTCQNIIGQIPFFISLYSLSLKIRNIIPKFQNYIPSILINWIIVEASLIFVFYYFDEFYFQQEQYIPHFLTFLTQMSPINTCLSFKYFGLIKGIFIIQFLVFITFFAIKFDKLELFDDQDFQKTYQIMDEYFKQLQKKQRDSTNIEFLQLMLILIILIGINILGHYQKTFLILVSNFYFSFMFLKYFNTFQDMKFKIVCFFFTVFIIHSIYANLFWQDHINIDIFRNYHNGMIVEILKTIPNVLLIIIFTFQLQFDIIENQDNRIMIEIVAMYFYIIQMFAFAQINNVIYSMIFQICSIYCQFYMFKKIKYLQLLVDNVYYLMLFNFNLTFRLSLLAPDLTISILFSIILSNLSIIALIDLKKTQSIVSNYLIYAFIILIQLQAIIQESGISLLISINFLIMHNCYEKYFKSNIIFYLSILALINLIVLLSGHAQIAILTLKNIFQQIPGNNLILKIIDPNNQIENQIAQFAIQLLQI